MQTTLQVPALIEFHKHPKIQKNEYNIVCVSSTTADKKGRLSYTYYVEHFNNLTEAQEFLKNSKTYKQIPGIWGLNSANLKLSKLWD